MKLVFSTHFRGQVLSTLDELRTITTHDDNLEKQYKEGQTIKISCLLPLIDACIFSKTVVTENVQLNSALEKAKGEIRVSKAVYHFRSLNHIVPLFL